MEELDFFDYISPPPDNRTEHKIRFDCLTDELNDTWDLIVDAALCRDIDTVLRYLDDIPKIENEIEKLEEDYAELI